eukprot:m.234213 g.234213  ORF g.234213 m.234213 type:complete len:806 (-) comp16035_c0_seq1:82-2499(-)
MWFNDEQNNFFDHCSCARANIRLTYNGTFDGKDEYVVTSNSAKDIKFKLQANDTLLRTAKYCYSRGDKFGPLIHTEKCELNYKEPKPKKPQYDPLQYTSDPIVLLAAWKEQRLNKENIACSFDEEIKSRLEQPHQIRHNGSCGSDCPQCKGLPAKYDLDAITRRDKSKKSERIIADPRETTAGPAAYSTHYDALSTATKGPSFSFGGPNLTNNNDTNTKKESKSNKRPLAYGGVNLPTAVYNNAPSFTMRGKPTTPKNREGKKPLAYGSNGLPTTYEKAPAYSMGGKVVVENNNNNNMPAPSQYNVVEDFGTNAPHYSIAGKNRVKSKKSDVPGPKYLADDTAIRPSLKGGKIGIKFEPKHKNNEQETPGPAAYNIEPEYNNDNDNNNNATFTKKRFPGGVMGVRTALPEDKNAENIPGPGSYVLQEKQKGPSYTMAPRLEVIKEDDYRDPGTTFESTSILYKQQPAARITGKPKTKKADNTPGPETAVIPVAEKRGSSAIMTAPHKHKSTDNTPGPETAYMPTFGGGGKKGVTLVGRPQSPKKEQRPGPETGAWDLGPKKSMKGTALITGKPKEPKIQPTPGPVSLDELEPPKTRRRGPSAMMIGKAKEHSLQQQQQLPGPETGVYTQPKRGPSALILGKAPDRDKLTTDLPGPETSTHNMNTLRRTSAAIITGRPKTPKSTDSPGPAAYSQQRAKKKKESRTPRLRSEALVNTKRYNTTRRKEEINNDEEAKQQARLQEQQERREAARREAERIAEQAERREAARRQAERLAEQAERREAARREAERIAEQAERRAAARANSE